AQQPKWKEMLGKPFTGSLASARGFGPAPANGPGGGRAAPALMAPMFLVLSGVGYATSPDLQKELKLTPAQVEKVAALEKAYQEEVGGRGGRGQARTQKQQAALEKLQKGLAQALDATQHRRLGQLLLQHHRKAGLDNLLLQPAAVAALRLSPAQVAR